MIQHNERLPVIGFTPVGAEVTQSLLKMEGVAGTDLLQFMKTLGSGEFCGILCLFELTDVKPVVYEEFLKGELPDVEDTLVLGHDQAGRSIVLGVFNHQPRFYLVDWKHDEVMSHGTFADCLRALFELSGLLDLYANPFHIGTQSRQMVFDVEWDPGTAVELLQNAIAQPVKKRAFGEKIRYWHVYDASGDFLVRVTDQEQQNFVWHYRVEVENSMEEVCRKWLDGVAAKGLPAPMRY